VGTIDDDDPRWLDLFSSITSSSSYSDIEFDDWMFCSDYRVSLL
jgi:hypothetical protein